MARKGYPAEFRRRALDLVASGKFGRRGGATARGQRSVDLAAIANRLNADRIPTAQAGRRWYPATIRYTLNRLNRPR